ncbi:hypothetical protein [Cellvibrio fibrivorans]|jgi:uncharacterized membrane protein YgcG|uniref:Membrane protein YgcG n=1 Tax=Cellvibrio fibrivorans TaxID=126350 RepID=A0ABU1UZ32_9GAMM|nr:hypothetical protein [Cellvibrio fibrivorans]MDR7090453.1 putative membrane protein YgcG [Cellvibrio fibrivorans]
MRRPILLLIIMAIAYSQSELMSQDIVKGVMFPLLFSAALLILLIWLVRRFHSNRRGDGGSGDSGDVFHSSGKSSDRDLGDGGGDGGGE